jgi:hypothetical protein
MGRSPQTAVPPLAVGAPPLEVPWEGPALQQRLQQVIGRTFQGLRRSVRTNLVVLTEALLLLVRGGRSGQGRLSLHAIARQLRTPGRPQSRYKRLHRFLDCPRFDPASGTSGLVQLALGVRPPTRLLPVLGDQTTIGTVQVLHLGTPYRFAALVSRFFVDTDFRMGSVLLQAEETRPQATRQAWKIAAGPKPDADDLQIVPVERGEEEIWPPDPDK